MHSLWSRGQNHPKIVLLYKLSPLDHPSGITPAGKSQGGNWNLTYK